MNFHINLIISGLMLFYCIVSTYRKGLVISPQIILWVGYIVFIYLNPFLFGSPYVLDEEFNLILYFATAGMIISSYIIPYDIINVSVSRQNIIISPKWLQIFAFAYWFYMLWNIGNQILISGSIIEALTRDRVDAYLSLHYLRGQNPLSLIMTLLQFPYYTYCIYLFKKQKKLIAFLFILTPMVHHLFVANTRFDMIAMVVAFLLYFYQNKNRQISRLKLTLTNLKNPVNKRKGFLGLAVVMLFIVMFSLGFMHLGNALRTGTLKDVRFNKLISIESAEKLVFIDLNYYSFLYNLHFHLERELIPYEWGKGWFLYPALSFIPRRIWPEKPVTSTSSRLTELLYWPLGTGRPVVTFTIFGQGLHELGHLGVFLAPILFVILYKVLFRLAKKTLHSDIYIYLMVFNMFTWMRGELPLVTIPLQILSVFIINKIFSLKWQKLNGRI